jgi:peptide/nickel transport system substrate-binding protein
VARRRQMVGEALRMVHDDLPYVPLYRRTLTWAMDKKVKAVQWPNDTIELRWVRISEP